MKKFLRNAALLICLIFSGTLTTHAQIFESGGIRYQKFYVNGQYCAYVTYSPQFKIEYTDDGLTIFSGNSYSGDLKIPETVMYDGEKLTVKGLYTYAFAGSQNLKSVSLPKTLENLESLPFLNCPNLKKVTIDSANEKFKVEGDAVLSKDGKTFCLLLPNVTGRYVIPEGVTTIQSGAFAYSKITSVVISKTLNEWSLNPFYLTFDLEKIEVASGGTFKAENGILYLGDALLACPAKKQGKVIVPENVKSIGGYAFAWCKNITGIELPSKLEYIGGGAFWNCTSLTDLTLPDNAKWAGDDIFIMSGIKNISVPSSRMRLGALRNCSELENVTIRPVDGETYYYSNDGVVYSGLESKKSLVLVPPGRTGHYDVASDVYIIGEYAFQRCKLSSLTIPENVAYMGQYAFSGCKLNPLYIECDNYCSLGKNVFSGLQSGSVVVLDWDEECASLNMTYPGITFVSSKCPGYITDVKTYLKGATWRIEKNQYYQGESKELSVYIDALGQPASLVNSDANGMYSVMNLEPGTEHTIYAVYGSGYNEYNEYRFKTSTHSFSYKTESTQTTVTVSDLDASSDEYMKLTGLGFIFDGKEYTYSGKPIVIKGLNPSTNYSLQIFADYGTERINNKASSVTTKGANPGISRSDLGPTSVVLIGTYNAGDAKVSRTYFTVGTDKTPLAEGTKYIATGLIPNRSYTFKFNVEFESGLIQTATLKEFTTPALELKTLQPKGVSSTCSIVAAETNISEYETNVGFQWKKYDAPESLKPSEGFAAIYDGMLEGYLRNLQPTSYYIVRAFYKTAGDSYYYGDWVTFDPSDFSYFEPTVHTYAVSDINHNSAQVRGYVIAGTDDIDEQGFEYWPANNVAKVKSVMGAPEQQGVITVLAKGQVMMATLTDLEPETTYICRAFVKTAAGITYGEEQTFSTEADPSGIESVAVDGKKVEVVGYYDLNGRCYDAPQRGLNIVVYSDGTAHKEVFK